MRLERATEDEKVGIAAALMRDAAAMLHRADALESGTCEEAMALRTNARRKVLTAVNWIRAVQCE